MPTLDMYVFVQAHVAQNWTGVYFGRLLGLRISPQAHASTEYSHMWSQTVCRDILATLYLLKHVQTYFISSYANFGLLGQLFLAQKYTMTHVAGNKYKFAQIVQETAAKYML